MAFETHTMEEAWLIIKSANLFYKAQTWPTHLALLPSLRQGVFFILGRRRGSTSGRLRLSNLARIGSSAMPLTWAHAEYVKLCASIGEKKVFDMPKQTQERYIHKKNKAHYATWNFNYQFESIKRNKKLRIQLTANADIHWTDNDWKTKHVSTTKEIALHLFSADISFNKISTKEIQFTFFWKDADKWENKTFAVSIV